MTSEPEKRTKPTLSGIYTTFIESETVLKRFIRRYLYKREDIDEIAQETFLRAYKATQGRDIDSPKAYLFQVARSLAYKELSRKTRILTDYLGDALEDEAGYGDPLEEELLAQQKVSFFLEGVAELPAQCRRVFLMRKVQAMSYKEIAAELNISVSAVEKHLALGAERCKKYVEIRELQVGEQGSSSASLAASESNKMPGGK